MWADSISVTLHLLPVNIVFEIVCDSCPFLFTKVEYPQNRNLKFIESVVYVPRSMNLLAIVLVYD